MQPNLKGNANIQRNQVFFKQINQITVDIGLLEHTVPKYFIVKPHLE